MYRTFILAVEQFILGFPRHAKQKSISLLTRKLKKNNEPCLFFHRFGKCSGKERETCVRQHDPKNVAVCKK